MGSSLTNVTRSNRSNASDRQFVINGAISGSSFNYIQSGSGLTVNVFADSSSNVMYLSFAGGYDDSGQVDYVAKVTSTTNLILTGSAKNFVFASYVPQTKSLSFSSTTVEPIYSPIAPTNIAGQYWFNSNSSIMYLGNGTTWTQVYVLFLGIVWTTASVISKIFHTKTYRDYYSLRSFEIPTRQTVCNGPTTAGLPSFMGGVGTTSLTVDASVKDIVIAMAAGNDNYGSVNYVATLKELFTINVSSVLNSTQYLYVDRDVNTGRVSMNYTHVPPQYIQTGLTSAFQFTSLLNCEAIAASFADTYSNYTWTNTGGTLDTTNFKFGAASYALTTSSTRITNSSIDLTQLSRFTIDCHIRFGTLPTTGTSSLIFASNVLTSTNCCRVTLNNTGGVLKTNLSLGTTDASFDIASAVAGTKTAWVAGTWYHVALTFDGSTYKVYVDGVLDTTVTSSLKANWKGVALGNNSAMTTISLAGNVDNFRVSPQLRYTGAFTAPTVAFVADESIDIFDISSMTMNAVGSSISTLNRTYLGEFVVGAATISSVTPYAYNGVYEGVNGSAVAVNSTYSFTHNIGCRQVIVDPFVQNIIAETWAAVGDRVYDPAAYNTAGAAFQSNYSAVCTKLAASVRTPDSQAFHTIGLTPTAGRWTAGIRIARAF